MLLRSILDEALPPEPNDGIVPLRSQLWGDCVWIGQADHPRCGWLLRPPEERLGWLTCGANFDRQSFATMMDRIVDGMLVGEALRAERLVETAVFGGYFE